MPGQASTPRACLGRRVFKTRHRPRDKETLRQTSGIQSALQHPYKLQKRAQVMTSTRETCTLLQTEAVPSVISRPSHHVERSFRVWLIRRCSATLKQRRRSREFMHWRHELENDAMARCAEGERGTQLSLRIRHPEQTSPARFLYVPTSRLVCAGLVLLMVLYECSGACRDHSHADDKRYKRTSFYLGRLCAQLARVSRHTAYDPSLVGDILRKARYFDHWTVDDLKRTCRTHGFARAGGTACLTNLRNWHAPRTNVSEARTRSWGFHAACACSHCSCNN